jgi:extradiol dioxygenase family protein
MAEPILLEIQQREQEILAYLSCAAGEETMFVRDPSGNALEFKSFKDRNRVFAT